jgi:hypothetical protein
VNYALETDAENTTRRLIIAIPASDVTSDNPADAQVSA